MVTGRSQMGDSHSNEFRVPFSASETKTELARVFQAKAQDLGKEVDKIWQEERGELCR